VDATSVFEGRLSSTFTVNDACVLQFNAPSLNRALVACETLLFAGRSPVLRLNDKLQIILCEPEKGDRYPEGLLGRRKPLSNQETYIIKANNCMVRYKVYRTADVNVRHRCDSLANTLTLLGFRPLVPCSHQASARPLPRRIMQYRAARQRS
jgi:hypothetical protein